MFNLIPLIVILLSSPNPVLAATYADAACTGGICAILRDQPTIQCIADPVGDTDPSDTGPYVVTPAVSSLSEPVFVSVAVNPTDGQIYVLYTIANAADATVYLGTIEEPSSDTAPFTVTRIGTGLATEQYTALSFDSAGNAYGVTSGREPQIIQLDLATGTEIADVEALKETSRTCNPFVSCHELIMYNFDMDEFIRISTAIGDSSVDPLLFVRSSIGGPDDPINGTVIDLNGVCGAADGIASATYIGNNVAAIYCAGSNRISMLDLSDITNPILGDEASDGFDLTDANAAGLFTYSADGSICKPPSMTPTISPTLLPTLAPISPPATKKPTPRPTPRPTRKPTRRPIVACGGSASGSGSAGGTHSGSNADSGSGCP